MFRILNIIGCSIIFFCTSFTFYVAVKDIFRLRHDLTYSLLGAANIFLLIGTIFGFLVNIAGSVFVGMVLPLDRLIEINNYANILSYFTLATVDLPYNNINPFIRTILIIESIFAHLFVVMIVGRLLSK